MALRSFSTAAVCSVINAEARTAAEFTGFQNVMNHLYTSIGMLPMIAVALDRARTELLRQFPVIATVNRGTFPTVDAYLSAVVLLVGTTVFVDGPQAGIGPTEIDASLQKFHARKPPAATGATTIDVNNLKKG